MSQTPGVKNYVLPKFFTCKGNLSARWYIEFQATNVDTGKLVKHRYVCPAKFETKKQREIWAKEWCGKITRLLEKGYSFGGKQETDVAPAKLILKTELETTLETIKATLRPATYTTYHSAVNKLSAYLKIPRQNGEVLTDIEVHVFSNQESVRFRDYLINELKNSSRTANNTLIHLNTMYGHLKERVSIPSSPFVMKKLKQPDTDKNIAFTRTDQKKIEAYLKEHEPLLYILTRFIYFAFIRPGELNQLLISDLHLENVTNPYIRVRGEISKTGSTETVDMIPPLIEIINGIDFRGHKQSDYVFGKGLYLSKSQSGKQVAFRRHEKAIRKMGFVESYTLYSWKHTGVVRAYESGVGIKELQKMLRHTSISTTEIYLKSLGLRTDPNLKKYSW